MSFSSPLISEKPFFSGLWRVVGFAKRRFLGIFIFNAKSLIVSYDIINLGLKMSEAYIAGQALFILGLVGLGYWVFKKFRNRKK